jgi:hypothetical protein
MFWGKQLEKKQRKNFKTKKIVLKGKKQKQTNSH